MIKSIVNNIFHHFLKQKTVQQLLVKNREKQLQIGSGCFLKRCRFGHYNRIYHDCHLVDVALGNRTYISEGCRMFDVAFGRYCAVGPRVTIGLGIHPSRTFVSVHPLFYSRSNSACAHPLSDGDYFTEHLPVVIGHDVWIGAEAILHDGIKVGNGAIIGSGAIVTKDVPAYAVVAGSPAKVLKYRFEPPEIEFLEGFSWWDKDELWLKRHWKEFHNIRDFMNKHIHTKDGTENE